MIEMLPTKTHLKVLHGLSWSEARDLFHFAKRRLVEENLDQVAGSLTFTSVLALVPMLTIAFAIFTTFPIFHTFSASLEAYFIQNLMPKAISNSIMGYLTGFASKAAGLSLIGAAGLLVTSLAMMAMIDRVFNRIWRVKTGRPVLQRVLVYWALVTLGPLLIGISMTVTANLFVVTGAVVGQVKMIGALFYTLISVGLTTVAFTMLYVTVPNRTVDWGDAAWGGLLAGLAFEIAKRLFAAFVARVPTYAMIYGALAAVPLFLVWIYLSWFITLVGAVLVAALPVIKYERWRHVAAPGGAFVDAMAILDALFQARHNGDTALVSNARLRANTRLGYDEMDSLLEKMRVAGWVGRVKGDAPPRVQWGKRFTEGIGNWVLLANPEQLTLADIYRLFVFNGSGAGFGDNPLAKKVETAVEQGLHLTLTEYFTQELA
jgi:membrane protein